MGVKAVGMPSAVGWGDGGGQPPRKRRGRRGGEREEEEGELQRLAALKHSTVGAKFKVRCGEKAAGWRDSGKAEGATVC